jgi:dTDP-4-dehydrorhamnose 3,5-epimerase
VDNYYSPENDRGIAFDDPALGIKWLVNKDSLKLSAKDTQQSTLANAEVFTSGQSLYA